MGIFLDAFSDQPVARTPFWFMRQAGRYMAEYRAVRAEVGDFLDLCYSPKHAMEVTLQPIQRFGMDAAIIFSDILVIPHALGSAVHFEKGEGPRVEPIRSGADIARLDESKMATHLAPVYQAIADTRAALPKETALIGFAGAPWTLACYMLEGRGKTDFAAARRAAYTTPSLLAALIGLLSSAVVEHLCAQVEAGADALQLFDTWASLVPVSQREALIVAPARAIIAEVKHRHPHVPIIAFPKGLGRDLAYYATTTGVDGLSVDMQTDISTMDVPCILQGNLDPLLLASSKEGTLREARRLREVMAKKKYVFNLGHGIVPDTPVEHVDALSELLREPHF
ncbi:MAG: uroporphyrinogen decarboxylase [Rickettsiales bacterium]|nr:uroporphyrinogen decarboxylase [Rickettsiales bacterium]